MASRAGVPDYWCEQLAHGRTHERLGPERPSSRVEVLFDDLEAGELE
ncbi:hypothetical protein [Natrialba swarupiae]|nr:hypothetical protein [Natrialba swarupiae]